jgi:inosine-uridine nucleoside N-ribohydrolase
MEYDKSIGKWIIDTDPGVDDAIAIMFALNYIKDDLVALSLEDGNGGLEQIYINAQKVCSLMKSSTPIYKGCKFNFSNVIKDPEESKEFHGCDGLYDIPDFKDYELRYDKTSNSKLQNLDFPIMEKYSPIKIIELCYKYDNLNILTLGPLTNIAAAFMLDPNIVNRLKKVVIMGGAYTHLGNVTESVEFNFFCDPIAARIVLENFDNVVLYPWEPSTLHLFTEEEIAICEKEEIGLFCKEIIRKKLACLEGAIFADYGAAVSAFCPSAIKRSRKMNVDVVIDSNNHKFDGCIVCYKSNKVDKSKKLITVVDELDHDEFINFFKRIVKL